MAYVPKRADVVLQVALVVREALYNGVAQFLHHRVIIRCHFNFFQDWVDNVPFRFSDGAHYCDTCGLERDTFAWLVIGVCLINGFPAQCVCISVGFPRYPPSDE